MIKPEVEGVATSYRELLELAPRYRTLDLAGQVLAALGWLCLAAAALLAVLTLPVLHDDAGGGDVLAALLLLGPAIGALITGVLLIVVGAAASTLVGIARDSNVAARAAVEVDGGFRAKDVLPGRKKRKSAGGRR